jgi:hypothetical protein
VQGRLKFCLTQLEPVHLKGEQLQLVIDLLQRPPFRWLYVFDGWIIFMLRVLLGVRLDVGETSREVTICVYMCSRCP